MSKKENTITDNAGRLNSADKKKKSKKKLVLLVIGAFLLLCIAVAAMDDDSGSSTNGKKDIEAYISLVKNGYLGEYTDITIEKLLENYYGTVYGADISWDGGTTEDGEIIVAAHVDSKNLGMESRIQFKMHDEEVFKVNAFEDDILMNASTEGKNPAPTDIAYGLINLYLTSNVQALDGETRIDALDSLSQKLDEIAGSSILYGASADYSGDRSKLCEIYGEAALDMSAKELSEYYNQ